MLYLLINSNIPHLKSFDFIALTKLHKKGIDRQTDRQTDRHTDISTTRPKRPRADSVKKGVVLNRTHGPTCGASKTRRCSRSDLWIVHTREVFNWWIDPAWSIKTRSCSGLDSHRALQMGRYSKLDPNICLVF